MANLGKTINSRVVLWNKTNTEWLNTDNVLLKGEIAIEFDVDSLDSSPMLKVGDGKKTFSQLPYVAAINDKYMTSEHVDLKIKESIEKVYNDMHSHDNFDILSKVTSPFVVNDKLRLDKTITKVIVDGYDYTTTDGDITLPDYPTRKSLDINYVDNTRDNVKEVATARALANEVTVKLYGDVQGNTTFDGSDNMSIFTTITNPTVIDSELSLTSARAVQNKVVTEKFQECTNLIDATNNSDINANRITGVLSLANIPLKAVSRYISVINDEARFNLSKDDVNIGDTVKVLSTGYAYLVTDTSKLMLNDGYMSYNNTHEHEISDVVGLSEVLSEKLSSDVFISHKNDMITHITNDERFQWSNNTKVESSGLNGNIKIDGVEVAVYEHDKYTPVNNQLVNITVNNNGHVTSTNAVTLSQLEDLGVSTDKLSDITAGEGISKTLSAGKTVLSVDVVNMNKLEIKEDETVILNGNRRS